MPECSLRALEFYSGVGGGCPLASVIMLLYQAVKRHVNIPKKLVAPGMHYGLQIGAPWANVVGAFEVHNIANDVYAHNFGWRPTQVLLIPPVPDTKEWIVCLPCIVAGKTPLHAIPR